MNDYVNPFSQNVREIAKQFDSAFNNKNISEIENLISNAESVIYNQEQSQENNASKAQLCYSIATAYGDIGNINGKTHDEELLKKELFYLRESIRLIETDEYNDEKYSPYVYGFKLSLYTNYGNNLKLCGRFISAIEQYHKALNINVNFGMALGNIGILYQQYGELVYDSFHRDYLHYFAYHNLLEAVSRNDLNIYDEARKGFEKHIGYYNAEYVNNVLLPDLEIPDKSFGSTEEYIYRKWGLENHLFLNPLNDLPISKDYFAMDEINLPNMIMKIDDKPIFHGMFNQIKQEYIYSRYLYYSSLEFSHKPHFADIDTQLVNLPDFPQYSIRIEKLKSSFKTLYGLFDKIGFFLNSYFELGIIEKDISFSSIWLNCHGKVGKRGYYAYSNVLNPNQNFALLSLYWIRKDFSESFENSPNPYLKRIKEIRNALEHKYVKVINDIWSNDYKSGKYDDLVFYVSESELYDITLNLLKILRESIICLSLCVHIEEEKKRDSLSSDTIICPINFGEYEDDWKT